jgi:hypothetical protein
MIIPGQFGLLCINHWKVLYKLYVFYADCNSKMTTTAGHSFYIGPIVFFYNQVNDTGSSEPLVWFCGPSSKIVSGDPDFQPRRFLWEFPIESYVKLSSAVVAILVGVLKCRTQFWKRTTQESFQQSLVEIGS